MRRQFKKRRIDEPRARIEAVYEDFDVIVIVKPAGLISYPLKDQHGDSAIQQIRKYWRNTRSKSRHLYLLHRLDRETTGLMVFAKNTKARRVLMSQFADHSVLRVYMALTDGIPDRTFGKIKTKMGRDIRGRRSVAHKGMLAVTRFEVVKTFPERNKALIRCILQTGRTHQVRIHLAYLRTPVVGDPVYGKPGGTMMLHAEALGFLHPRTQKPIVFRTSIPFSGLQIPATDKRSPLK